MPVAHISWAIADNADRKPCDQWLIDTFGAEVVYEMLMTPEAEKMGLDREETLMMIGDTMVIPIAPAPSGPAADAPTGQMLRRNAGSMRWLGLALKVADLKAAAAWFQAKGFTLHFDPGMEKIYFLVGRKQALGVRLEILATDLPNDPRQKPGWNPSRWRDDHPLGIEGLQSIGVSAATFAAARECFGDKLELTELGQRDLPGEEADCVAFDLGDTVIEAMVPKGDDSVLSWHVNNVQGIYCLTFKVKSAAAAEAYLKAKGHELVGDVSTRFGIHPREAHERMIFFTEHDVPGYPPLGSKLLEPAQFPVVA